jgi:hypothetical protein
MEDRDGFLSRWSRLKRNAGAAPPSERESDSKAAPVEEQVLPEGKTLEQLVAELPRIEDLVPGQSLAAFMQSWVPTAIRNAALQRMWLLDPAIRGYVDPALDYAYDYNALGGAPGFGPIETSQEAIAEVAEMFDRALGRGGPVDEDRRAPETAAARDGEDAQTIGSNSGPAVARSDAHPDAPAPENREDIATHHKRSDRKDLAPAVRRHGGALPS